jgi:hypothetical protein
MSKLMVGCLFRLEEKEIQNGGTFFKRMVCLFSTDGVGKL